MWRGLEDAVPTPAPDTAGASVWGCSLPKFMKALPLLVRDNSRQTCGLLNPVTDLRLVGQAAYQPLLQVDVY